MYILSNSCWNRIFSCSSAARKIRPKIEKTQWTQIIQTFPKSIYQISVCARNLGLSSLDGWNFTVKTPEILFKSQFCTIFGVTKTVARHSKHKLKKNPSKKLKAIGKSSRKGLLKSEFALILGDQKTDDVKIARRRLKNKKKSLRKMRKGSKFGLSSFKPCLLLNTQLATIFLGQRGCSWTTINLNFRIWN